jgi:hypothetical protein
MSDEPLLTERMKNDRLEFARPYNRWGVEQWMKVLFSYESHLELRFSSQKIEGLR